MINKHNLSNFVQPKIYSEQDHAISINSIDLHALYIIEKLKEAGFKAYLVGGSVRDLLLKTKPKDFDISTSAKPEEIKKIFRNCILIGRRFRLAHIRFGRKVYEVATFRAGQENDELIIHDNVWGTEEEDVLRRDFTINGLYYDPTNQTIIDYVGGFDDTLNKHMRCIGHPFKRFKQDPVRMIRLLKFEARFGFTTDQETEVAMLECRAEICKSSQARILEELLRMLESGHSQTFFHLMSEKGLLQFLLPGASSFLEKKDGNEIYSYLEEIDRITLDPEEKPLNRAILLSAFLFPHFESHIDKRFVQLEKYPSLETIYNESLQVISDIFGSFFTIPKRLKFHISCILSSQYRITPLKKKPLAKLRVPRIIEFTDAVTFLKIRSQIEPGLQSLVETWEELLIKNPPTRSIQAPKKRYGPPRNRKRRSS